LRAEVPAYDFCFASAGDGILSLHWPGDGEFTQESLSRSQVLYWRPDAGGQWGEASRTSVPGAIACFANTRGMYALAWEAAQPLVKLIELKGNTTVASFEIPLLICPGCFRADLSPGGEQLALATETANVEGAGSGSQ